MHLSEVRDDVLSGINPPIADHFSNISKIPRRSGNEGGVKKYIAEWAERLNFKYRVDEVGNIAIDIPATPGYEHVPRVVIQAHMDMVCAQLDGGTHNFEQDQIRLAESDGFLHSEGFQTTLGADDAMGIAMALAAVQDPTSIHGPITILCTVDEETGLTGATQLGPQMIPADSDKIFLVNIDAEEGEHAAAHGSAGGTVTVAEMNLEDRLETIRSGHEIFHIQLQGLLSGHSGVEVHKGHGNAISLLSRFLKSLDCEIPEFQLLSFTGGKGISIIPGTAECDIAVPPEHMECLSELVKQFESKTRGQLGAEKTSNLSIVCEQQHSSEEQALIADTRSKVIHALSGLAKFDGVLFADDPEHPLVSSTTGVVTTTSEKITVKNHSRAAMTNLEDLKSITRTLRQTLTTNDFVVLDGGLPKESGDYPGWQEPDNSEAIDAVRHAHAEVFGTPIYVFAYHAGIEAGALKETIEKNTGKPVSCVAIGPLIKEAHTIRERASKVSINETYRLLVKLLEKLAKK